MDKLTIKLLKTDNEKKKSYALRHRVFTLEKKWTDSKALETDSFDEFAKFLGVIFNGELVAYTRIIEHNHPWMLDSIFSHLLVEPIKKTPQSAELTRYFVSPDYRNQQIINGQKVMFSRLLHQAVHCFAVLNSITEVYCVFTYKVFRLMRFQKIPTQNLNKNIIIADDKETAVPVMIDYKDLDKKSLTFGGLSDFLENRLLFN